MPKVYNKRQKDVPKDAIYVGRPTEWGNPYSHQNGTLATHKVASREEAVLRFYDMVWSADNEVLRLDIKEKLRGKDLVCWCKPAPCHADILLEIANSG